MALAQFFLGGLFLYVAAEIFLISAPGDTEYDGVVTLIGWAIVGVSVAVPSMIVAMIVGLPLRLVPRLRARWLANGEITVAGVVVGFVLCAIATPPASLGGESGGWSDAAWWVLLASWALLAISVAHFVWPARWLRVDPRG